MAAEGRLMLNRDEYLYICDCNNSSKMIVKVMFIIIINIIT